MLPRERLTGILKLGAVKREKCSASEFADEFSSSSERRLIMKRLMRIEG